MVIRVEVVTALVFIVKTAPVAPAGMITLAGTVATAGLLVDRETRVPPRGAGAFSATLPVDGDPPWTLSGFSVSEVRVGPGEDCGVTVSEAA
jgi:hypothetical protein